MQERAESVVEPVKTGGHENDCFVSKATNIRQIYSPEYRTFYFVSDMNF